MIKVEVELRCSLRNLEKAVTKVWRILMPAPPTKDIDFLTFSDHWSCERLDIDDITFDVNTQVYTISCHNRTLYNDGQWEAELRSHEDMEDQWSPPEDEPEDDEPKQVVYVVLYCNRWDYSEREDCELFGVYESFSDAKKVAEYQLQRGYPNGVFPWQPAGNNPERVMCGYTDHWKDENGQERWNRYTLHIMPQYIGGGEP